MQVSNIKTVLIHCNINNSYGHNNSNNNNFNFRVIHNKEGVNN